MACDSTVRAGDSAAALFAIPLDGGSSSSAPVITGIEAMSSQPPRYPIPVSGTATSSSGRQVDGVEAVTVTATLHNPTSKWMWLPTACATIRDRRGDVVGVAPLFEPSRYGFNINSIIPPGGSTTVAGTTFVIGVANSSVVQAFGEPMAQEPIIGPPLP